MRERGGSVVDCRTPEREVGGSRPTAAVLCPWARHFTPRKYWLITQEAVAPSRHDWKIVDWDVKPQHKQTKYMHACMHAPTHACTYVRTHAHTHIYRYIRKNERTDGRTDRLTRRQTYTPFFFLSSSFLLLSSYFLVLTSYFLVLIS